MEPSTRKWVLRHKRRPSELLDKYISEVDELDHHPLRHGEKNWARFRMRKLYHTPGVPGGSLHSSFIFAAVWQ